MTEPLQNKYGAEKNSVLAQSLCDDYINVYEEEPTTGAAAQHVGSARL
jgi:hypothetical protein